MSIRQKYFDLRCTVERFLVSIRGAGGPPAQSRRLELEGLEERILYSAAPAAAAIPEAVHVAPVDPSFEAALDSPLDTPTDDPQSTNDTQANAESTTLGSLADVRRELVFVDTGAGDHQELVADLLANEDTKREFEVVFLDGKLDGVEQISEVLAERGEVDAIHIISHGTDGQVKLGDMWLSIDKLAGYSSEFTIWANALSVDADVLFYGCELASNDNGRDFVEALAALTGADVAASDDNTGHAQFGGDWDLEYSIGWIETSIAFSQEVQQSWNGLLATVTVDTTNDIQDGNTSSVAALIGSPGADGKISLREALLATNNDNGLDEIHFNISDDDLRHFYYRDDGTSGSLSLIVATTLDDASIGDFDPDYPFLAHSWFSIDLNSALPQLDITDTVIIDGYTQAGAVVNTLAVGDDAVLRIELTSDGGGGNRGLTVENGGDGSTIRGLAINNFNASGILTEPGADSVTVHGNFLGTDITGTLDVGNGDSGIQLRSRNNQIGGPNAEDRNVISGNDGRGVVTFTFGPIETANVVENNYIGVDATGLNAVGNDTAGIQVFNQNNMQILDNVIAGNAGDGVWLRAGSTNTNTVIQGNLIGVGADGAASVGNTAAGILIESSGNNSVIASVTITVTPSAVAVPAGPTTEPVIEVNTTDIDDSPVILEENVSSTTSQLQTIVATATSRPAVQPVVSQISPVVPFIETEQAAYVAHRQIDDYLIKALRPGQTSDPLPLEVARPSDPSVDYLAYFQVNPGPLWDDLNQLQEELAGFGSVQLIVGAAAVTGFTGLTAGYVIWTIRTGALFTSLLANMPAWRFVDPLVVLNYDVNHEDEDEESLQSILENGVPGQKTATPVRAV